MVRLRGVLLDGSFDASALRPARVGVAHQDSLLLGIGGNLAIVGLYLLTRMVGIPLFGPGAGEVEEIGFVDLCATTSEVGIAVVLEAALLRETTTERRRMILLVAAVVLVSVGHVVHLVLRAS